MPSVVSFFSDKIQYKKYNRPLYDDKKEEQRIGKEHLPATNLVQLEEINNTKNYEQMVQQG